MFRLKHDFEKLKSEFLKEGLNSFYFFRGFLGSLMRLLERVVAVECRVLGRGCIMLKMDVYNGNKVFCVLSLWEKRERERENILSSANKHKQTRVFFWV